MRFGMRITIAAILLQAIAATSALAGGAAGIGPGLGPMTLSRAPPHSQTASLATLRGILTDAAIQIVTSLMAGKFADPVGTAKTVYQFADTVADEAVSFDKDFKPRVPKAVADQIDNYTNFGQNPVTTIDTLHDIQKDVILALNCGQQFGRVNYVKRFVEEELKRRGLNAY